MAMTEQDMQAEQDAWSKQYDTEQAAAKADTDTFSKQYDQENPSLLTRFTGAVGNMTLRGIDSAMSAADAFGQSQLGRKVHDAQAGVITGAVNTVDAAGSALASSGRGMAMAEDPAHADDAAAGTMPTSPIWDHAKGAIMDFRDAVAVKDPTLSDNLVQAAAQLAVPFAGYSRLLSGVHGFANIVGANALTDATALGPHDPRMADLISMGRQVEGKFGEALRTLAPDGSALNAYINFLGDRGTGRSELSDLQAAHGSEGTDPSSWGKREDGTDKGRGWLGLMRRPDGQVSSELSVSSDINGQETLFPLLVPGLSKDQVQQVLAATPEEAMKIPGVMQAASEFAKQRIAAGKSPFAGQDESPTYESGAEGRLKNILDGFGANLVATPLLHAVASGLKYGTAGLRYAIENGVGSASDIAPPRSSVAEGYAPQDMNLSKEQRAAERERIATLRDKEEGITQEPVPEPIPLRTAEVEGEAARRARSDENVAAMAPRGDGVGPVTAAAFPPVTASAADVSAGMSQNRSAVSTLRTVIKKFNEQGGPTEDAGPDGMAQQPFGQGMPLHKAITTLNKNLSRATPQGAFYGEILDRLQEKKLPTEMVASGTGAHSGNSMKALGTYSDLEDSIAIHAGAIAGNNQTLLHTFAHEAVHAATMKALGEQPEVANALKSIFEDAEKSPAVAKLTDADRYGLSRTAVHDVKVPITGADGKPIVGGQPMVHELVAEAEANPRFRKALQDTPSEHGGSLWDDYKAVIGGILGVSSATLMSPHFDKLLTKEKTGA